MDPIVQVLKEAVGLALAAMAFWHLFSLTKWFAGGGAGRLIHRRPKHQRDVSLKNGSTDVRFRPPTRAPFGEEDWKDCKEPKPMLKYLIASPHPRVQDVEAFPECKGSDRKLRLFACACYGRLGSLLPDPRARAAVEVAERFADGKASTHELELAAAQVRQPLNDLEGRWRSSRGVESAALTPTHGALALGGVICWAQAQKAAYYAASNASWVLAAIQNPGDSLSGSGFGAGQRSEERSQADLLRCIFGNPFRRVTADPRWMTSGVVALARTIYDERAFDRLSSLADALEGAGCEDESILTHCRSVSGHARGCWVVDLVLGKE
jgi:hypothetical protein